MRYIRPRARLTMLYIDPQLDVTRVCICIEFAVCRKTAQRVVSTFVKWENTEEVPRENDFLLELNVMLRTREKKMTILRSGIIFRMTDIFQ